MNTLLKKAIEKRKNPEKYNFEVFQRELEKQRSESLKEMLSLTPIIEYLKNAIDSLVSSHEDSLTETAANAVIDVIESCDDQKTSFESFIKTKSDEVHTHFASLEENINKQSSLFGKEKDFILAETKRYLKELELKTMDEIHSIFSDASKFKGDKGDEGKQGEKGDKGDSVTKEEILAELEPEIVNIKQEIKRVSSNTPRGIGGGMGNVQHESKAVSSGTTSVNTTYTIGGGGYALWAYYQGQLIMRGVHYTVSGKTISLLFTPDDNTAIDVIYIR